MALYHSTPVGLLSGDIPGFAKASYDAEHAMLSLGIDDPTNGYYSPTFYGGGQVPEQTFFDGVREIVLGRSSMTHDQAPMVAHEPGWASGLGWWVNVPEGARVFHASQLSAEAFVHAGSGGSLLCIDPARELVVVWLSIWAGLDLTKPNLFVDALVESIIS